MIVGPTVSPVSTTMVLTPTPAPIITVSPAGPPVGTTGPPGPSSPAHHLTGPPPSEWTSLSNESTTTRWGYVAWAAPIRSSPLTAAAVIGSLHLFTEERTPTVYEALSRWVDRAGRAWLRIRVPLVRDSSLRGWIPANALGTLYTDHTALRIDTGALRATLYDSGHIVWTAPVGIGKPGTTTPHGHFYIREGLRLGTACMGCTRSGRAPTPRR